VDRLLVAGRLAAAPGLGPRRVRRILDVFGDLDAFLRDAPAGGEWDALLAAATTRRPGEEAELAAWSRTAQIIGIFDEAYPPRLRQLSDPPIRLFVRGRLPEAWPEPRVVLVGTRRPSFYGARIGERLAAELATAGVAVGSGLALGIDGAVHRAALTAHGFTFAVLGSGPDVAQPARHTDLLAQIAECGSVVSEYPPGVEAQPWHFPARNRILAGLADAVVVVEGRAKSGSLITADLALELGREVLAVPGRIGDAMAEAPNGLIARGAAPALDATTVLAAAGWVERARVEAPLHPDVPDALRGLLDTIPIAGTIHVDELAQRTARAIPDLMSELLELELLGWVQTWPGKHYGRSLPTGRA
jgi:DNA processing protein